MTTDDLTRNNQAVRHVGERLLEMQDEHPRSLMGRITVLESLLRRLANHAGRNPTAAVTDVIRDSFLDVCEGHLDQPVDQGDEFVQGARAESRLLNTMLLGESV